VSRPTAAERLAVSEALLTSRELATILGFSASTVQDWYETGQLPGFRIGGRLRFRQSEVLEWLEERRNVHPEREQVRA